MQGPQDLLKIQLKSANSDDVHARNCTGEAVTFCFCCLKPMDSNEKRFIDGKWMEVESEFVKKNISVSKSNIMINFCQKNLVEDNNSVKVCFLCEPFILKYKSQNAKNSEDNPVVAMQNVLRYLDGDFDSKINRLAVLKSCISLSHTVTTKQDVVVRHPFRNPPNEIMEGVLGFLEYVSKLEKRPYRELSVCIMSIIVSIRWLHMGIGIGWYRSDQSGNCESSMMRRATMNGCTDMLKRYVSSHIDLDECFQYPCSLGCAGCNDDHQKLMKTEICNYSSQMLTPWGELEPFLDHKISANSEIEHPPYTVLCTRTNTVQLRSYSFYRRVLAQGVPVEFVETNPRAFYSAALSAHRSKKKI